MTTDTQEVVEKWAATAAAAAAECLPRPELINIPVINVKQDFSSVQSLSGCGGDCYCWCDCTLVCRNYSVIVRTTGVDQVQYTHLYMKGIHL